jgi:hypothetical protein
MVTSLSPLMSCKCWILLWWLFKFFLSETSYLTLFWNASGEGHIDRGLGGETKLPNTKLPTPETTTMTTTTNTHRKHEASDDETAPANQGISYGGKKESG